MRLVDIRQWQWMLISLLLGAAIGYTRGQAAADLEAGFGESLNGQAHFEHALLAKEQGRPCFTDIAVHPVAVPDGKGGTRRATLVSGTFFNGQYQQADGKLTASWHPAFFLADNPYHPKTDLSQLGRPDLAARYQSLAQPTVSDFLDVLSRTRGIAYTNAWWLGIGPIGWTVCCFLVVGVAWPIAINLMFYRSWRRPAVEKGIDLSKVKPPPVPQKVTVPSDEDLARLHELEAELEGHIVDAEPAPPAPETEHAAPPRPLTAAQLEAVEAAAKADTEYRTRDDDFYPTARGPAGKSARG